MRRLDPPTFDISATYLTCISNARPATKKHLETFEGPVVGAGNQYETAAKNQALHNLKGIAAQPANQADRKALRKVYKDRMAKEDAPGRDIYDAIKGAGGELCPLCGIGKVTTIDHQLPQRKYPLLAVVPVNLVPACRDCNTGKREEAPDTAEEQTLHPYYDDLFHVPWLAARLLKKTGSKPMTAQFYVSAPVDWDPLLIARLKTHLRVFDLDERYRLQVANHLSTLFHMFSGRPRKGITDHLTRSAASWTKTNPNSWESALYRAMATDTWYINGGWKDAAPPHL
ncbi:HNH endonuclease [Streptomyces sp. DB-54]